MTRSLIASYLVLSAADLAITSHIFLAGHLHERNPVARFALEEAGINGLALLKASMVLTVIGIAAAIRKKSPRASKFLMWTAVLSALAVVAYSSLYYLPL